MSNLSEVSVGTGVIEMVSQCLEGLEYSRRGFSVDKRSVNN